MRKGKDMTSNWTEDAACTSSPPEIFHIIDREHPLGRGLNDVERDELTNANFDQAATICASCPVLDACRSSMTTDDYRYVFRAGMSPIYFDKRRVDAPELEGGDRRCKRGHPLDGSKTRGRCWPCREVVRADLQRKRPPRVRNRGPQATVGVVQ
jgi:hypothetical protein